MRRLFLALTVPAVMTGAAAAAPSVADLMKMSVDPAAAAFWAAGNDPPEGETPEAAAARWLSAAGAVETLKTEAARLQAPPFSQDQAWGRFALMMGEAAESGRTAIAARDAEAAFEAGGRLYEACDGCHKAYAPRRP